MPSKKKAVSQEIILTVPDKDSLKEFLGEATKIARQQWKLAHPQYVKNKGGRPSLKQVVHFSCAKVWQDYGGKAPKNYSYYQFIGKVQKAVNPLKGEVHRNTIEKHVKTWIVEQSQKSHTFFLNLSTRLMNRPEFRSGLKALVKVGLEVNKMFYVPYIEKRHPKKPLNKIIEMEEKGTIPPLSLKKKMDAYREKRLKELAHHSPQIKNSLTCMGFKVEP